MSTLTRESRFNVTWQLDIANRLGSPQEISAKLVQFSNDFAVKFMLCLDDMNYFDSITELKKKIGWFSVLLVIFLSFPR